MNNTAAIKMASVAKPVASPSDCKQQSLMQHSKSSTVSTRAKVDNLPPEILIKIFIQIAIDSGAWDEVISFAMSTRNTYACFQEHYPHILTKAAMRYTPCGPGMPELVVKAGIAEMTRRWRFASFTEDFMNDIYPSTIRDLLKPWMCHDLLAWLRDGEEIWSDSWTSSIEQSAMLRCPDWLKGVPIAQRADVYKVHLDCEMFNHGRFQEVDEEIPSLPKSEITPLKKLQAIKARLGDILGHVQGFPMPDVRLNPFPGWNSRKMIELDWSEVNYFPFWRDLS